MAKALHIHVNIVTAYSAVEDITTIKINELKALWLYIGMSLCRIWCTVRQVTAAVELKFVESSSGF